MPCAQLFSNFKNVFIESLNAIKVTRVSTGVELMVLKLKKLQSWWNIQPGLGMMQ